MTAKTKAPPSFKQLQAEWYQKIKDSGFQEIEQKDGNLKLWATSYFRAKYDENTYRAKEEYYRLAGIFLNEYAFESKFEQCCWELHAEGMGIRNIALLLKKRGFKTYKRMVHETLTRLANQMVTRNTQSKVNEPK